MTDSTEQTVEDPNKAYQKQTRIERIRQYNRQYRTTHKEDLKLKNRLYKRRQWQELRKKAAAYRERTREQERARRRLYRLNPKVREKDRERSNAHHARQRVLVINHYSNGRPGCICCKEKNFEFLTVHHIEKNGAEHRKQIGALYAWIIRNNFPAMFDVRCFNCNCALQYSGYCPHTLLRINS